MELRSLKLEDRDKIEALRKKYGHDTSSHAFASLYIWKDELQLSIYMQERLFAVKVGAYGENTWFFPCGAKPDSKRFLQEVLKEPEPILLYIREEDKLFLEHNFPSEFVLMERPDFHEYMYDRIKQEDLKGRKYSKLRNHINRITKDHNLSFRFLDGETLHEAMEIVSQWDKDMPMSQALPVTDRQAAQLLLSNAKSLEVSGVVVYVEEVPYAIVAGFPLSHDTFDMCIAKQKGNLSGLSVYAKNRFIKSIPKQYKYINAEEDLGIEGLRTMKEQMRPSGQIKMFEGRAYSGGEASHN